MTAHDHTPVLEIRNLRKSFPIKASLWNCHRKTFDAVRSVSLKIDSGKTLGLVGESGCGKTTLGQSIAGIYSIDEGQIAFKGQLLKSFNNFFQKETRRKIQMIFQNPYASLHPKMTILEILAEPFLIHRRVLNSYEKKSVPFMAAELLNAVGLNSSDLSKHPDEFSGGQKQRISIARAIALKPDLIIADEPTSALDTYTRLQICNLLTQLKKKFNMSYLLIAHDLNVIRSMSEHVAVMYLGTIVEKGPADAILNTPAHPYTRALVASSPSIQRNPNYLKIVLTGDVPNPANPPFGCHFHPRCPFAETRCKNEAPAYRKIGNLVDERGVSCHFA